MLKQVANKVAPLIINPVYPVCAQITVTGGGSANPSGLAFPVRSLMASSSFIVVANLYMCSRGYTMLLIPVFFSSKRYYF